MSTEIRYNEFVIKFANVNGSGSASANTFCARALFRMGIPVSAKNIFPSNIQGMPTWYEIRASQSGKLARRDGIDVMVAMNPQTYAQDLAEVVPGGTLLYDSSWPRTFERDDINVLGVPIAKLVARVFKDARQRQLFKNITYLGAMTLLLGIDIEVVTRLLAEQFRSKPDLVGPNVQALEIGREYLRANPPPPVPVQARASDAARGKIMITGNEAAALGAIYAGATVASWYPITPSTSLAEAFEKHARRLRKDDKGGLRAAVIQAEDELAAIGMAIGANWNGARAFTATSGPGISLMGEFLGLAYFAEIPVVLFDIQRGGPSTGMPTRTQQSDILACAYASHGDTRHVLLFPSDPNECFTFSAEAFDLADRLQTPVIVMSDLDIGMNDWVVDPLEWAEARVHDRGKLLSADALEEISDFARYRDVDGDAIGYRTIPGSHPDKGAFFTRGTSHNEYGGYTEDGNMHAETLRRLKRKFTTAAGLVPKPVVRTLSAKSRLGVINIGGTDLAVREAIDRFAAEGRGLNHMRIRAFPFTGEVAEFADRHDYVFVVEQNRDAQLRSLIVSETSIAGDKLVPILNFDGLPLTAASVHEAISDVLQSNPEVEEAVSAPLTVA
jgi:2-oxoglutarate ferredoxin oxidoreductase subunit alpha